MKIVGVLFLATLFSSVAAFGHEGFRSGVFNFNNRVGTEVDARFVLPTDPPGESSVGTDFNIRLFGGRLGAPVEQLKPLTHYNPLTEQYEEPQLRFRGAAGTPTAGYTVSAILSVPGLSFGDEATILVRVFDSPSWQTASYRFEGTYPVRLASVPNLQLGTSPLVLSVVPEPAPVTLALFGLAAAALCQRWRFLRRVRKFGPQGARQGFSASIEVYTPARGQPPC